MFYKIIFRLKKCCFCNICKCSEHTKILYYIIVIYNGYNIYNITQLNNTGSKSNIIIIYLQFCTCFMSCSCLLCYILYYLLYCILNILYYCFLYGRFCNGRIQINKGFARYPPALPRRAEPVGRLPPQFSEIFEMVLRVAHSDKDCT